MSKSLSLLSGGGGGGGGDGGSGMFCLFLFVELLSTKLSFPLVFLVVVSSLTSSRSGLTSPVDFQLQLFICSSKFSIASKVVFGRGGAPSCVG